MLVCVRACACVCVCVCVCVCGHRAEPVSFIGPVAGGHLYGCVALALIAYGITDRVVIVDPFRPKTFDHAFQALQVLSVSLCLCVSLCLSSSDSALTLSCPRALGWCRPAVRSATTSDRWPLLCRLCSALSMLGRSV